MRIAVIGTGNGGQTLAGRLSMLGHDVILYGRNEAVISELKIKKKIELRGVISGYSQTIEYTTDLYQAVKGSELLLVVTTANAHREIAQKIASYLSPEQILILFPGRTAGVLEFISVLRKNNNYSPYIAEAQTLVYACRLIENGVVDIIGVKTSVYLSALESKNTDYIIDRIKSIFPFFKSASSVLQTSFENIGAVFHPCVLLLNSAGIERGSTFYFYRDVTPLVADFIDSFDKERICLGKAYGLDLISAKDWVSAAYSEIRGNSLLERMQNNPAYYEIKAPSTLYCRQLLEDIPTGLIPMCEIGKLKGVQMPLFQSLITLASSLLKVDFYRDGRTLDKIGIEYPDIKKLLLNE